MLACRGLRPFRWRARSRLCPQCLGLISKCFRESEYSGYIRYRDPSIRHVPTSPTEPQQGPHWHAKRWELRLFGRAPMTLHPCLCVELRLTTGHRMKSIVCADGQYPEGIDSSVLRQLRIRTPCGAKTL